VLAPVLSSAGGGSGGFVVASIVSRRYLALARVTAASLRLHQPDLPFVLLLVDGDGRADDESADYSLLSPAALGVADLPGLRFRHGELELTYALTPRLIDHLLDAGHAGVVFLKQETLILDTLAPVLTRAHGNAALLTPHFLTPPEGEDALRREFGVLLAGIFNGGFMVFAAADEARAFLGWWWRKTAPGCYWDVAHGRHFEQRWLDFAPSLMPSCRVLRDPGVNIGHWNLKERCLRADRDGFSVDGSRCRVFRFSGYQPEYPERVTRHNPDFLVDHTGDAAAIFAAYRRQLLAAGHAAYQQQHYAFDRFDNGVAITDAMRQAYRRLGDAAAEFGNPFAGSAAGSFLAWYRTGAAAP
jgi:hypothetical protein